MSMFHMQTTLVDGSRGGKTQIVAYLPNRKERFLVQIHRDSKPHT